MNEDKFNLEMRKFLKTVGITSQREIESAVREGIDSGTIRGNETLSATVRLEIGQIGLKHQITGKISLE